MSIYLTRTTDAAQRLRAELPALNILRPERLALDPPASMVSSSEVLGASMSRA
jgi:hypothetical protein